MLPNETSITNLNIILKWLHDQLNELTTKIKYKTEEYKLILKKESFINYNYIFAMRTRIIDRFEI